jgi:hypothetical protein
MIDIFYNTIILIVIIIMIGLFYSYMIVVRYKEKKQIKTIWKRCFTCKKFYTITYQKDNTTSVCPHCKIINTDFTKHKNNSK